MSYKKLKEKSLLFLKLIIGNIHDILILVGLGFFIFTMFAVSKFVGMLSLSIILIVVGLILAKISQQRR